MKLRVIIPNAGMEPETLRAREQMLKQVARPETEITVECIAGGPVSIESEYDEMMAAPEIIERVIRAEAEGADAAIIYCLSDPALGACREQVRIPVIGPGQASLLLAAMLGRRISLLTVLPETVPRHRDNVLHVGVDPAKIASVRSVGIPVCNVRDDIPATVARLIDVGRQCLDEDGADVLVLGCLGFAGMGPDVTAALDVPVVDPAFAAVNLAELMHLQGLRHSRRGYPIPATKVRSS